MNARAAAQVDRLRTAAWHLQATVAPRARTWDDTRAIVPLIATLALVVNLYAIGWGLPNGNETWAADAIKPGTPLSVAQRIVAERWNSGWFWFKYPLGHVLILCAVYAPYLAFLWLTGRVGTPSSEYPYGVLRPEEALSTLALLGRGVSAVMGAGCVVLVYLTTRRLFGRVAGLAAALITTFAYPVVFYAHTTNVEIPYLFWAALTLFAGVQLLAGGGPVWYGVLGGAAAMAVSTKELAAGFVGATVLVAVTVQWWRGGRGWRLPRGAVSGLVVALAVFTLANNIVLNPLGFWHRVQLLTHTLDPEVRERYAPYYFPVELGASRGIGVELAQLKTTARLCVTSLGWPTSLLALLGLVTAAVGRPVATAVLVLPGAAFYLLGLRAMMSPSLRYVLPLTLLGAIFAGAGASWALRVGRGRWVCRLLVGVALVHCVLYGWDVDRMLAGDGRYAAEAWLARHVSLAANIEVYQQPTYLPRFAPGLRAQRVSFDEIRSEAFARRRPDYVVLSSAALSGVTVRYSEDWAAPRAPSEDLVPARPSASGRIMSYVHPGNQAFLAALRGGTLGYVPVARFRATPLIDRPLIQSLNPEITIFGRPGEPAREAIP